MGEAVITLSDQGINYSNQAGHKILFYCSHQQEEAVKEQCLDELIKLKEIEELEGLTKVLDEDRKLLQQKMLDVRLFEVYSVKGEVVEGSASHSLNQLIETPDLDFENTIFSCKLVYIQDDGEQEEQGYFQICISTLEAFDSHFRVVNI